jgi:UDP-N-acetylglucosamine 2-epimerase (non-hydrolysing)
MFSFRLWFTVQRCISLFAGEQLLLEIMIAIVMGTRPEIIKMSPVVRACQSKGIDFFILHTGQHYSYSMDKVFFEELELPEPSHNLEVGSGSHGEQTGKIIAGVEKILLKERTSIVLVQGDTNTVLGAALAASKLGIKIGHVEAGLRSFDRSMPEETNRILADHISDYLFVPTQAAKMNLANEGIRKGVYVTGNTIVDAVRQNLVFAKRKSKMLEELQLEQNGFILATAHRQENVDDRERLKGIIEGLKSVSQKMSMSVLLPAHPRTQNRLKKFRIDAAGISVVDPIGYLDFLQLEANAALILTDSGGIQEEACILGVKCVTLRENTERPETIQVGSNVLAGTDPKRILAQSNKMLLSKGKWNNPFGDGNAAKRIIERINKEGWT